VHRLAPAVPGPARLGVVADAGGRNQRGVHQRAGAHRDTLRVELARDGLEQRPVQATADQLAPEADEGGALGGGLVGGEAAEAAEAGAVVQRLGQPDVGEVVPGGQQQRPEQRQRRPAGLAPRRRRDADQGAVDLRPVEQGGEFNERRTWPRLRPRDEVLLPDPPPWHAALHHQTEAANQAGCRASKHIRAQTL
jgi:hypothetical protein